MIPSSHRSLSAPVSYTDGSAPFSNTDGSPITYIDGGCTAPVSNTDDSPITYIDDYPTSHHTVGTETRVDIDALRFESQKIDNTYCVLSFGRKKVDEIYSHSTLHTAPLNMRIHVCLRTI